MQAKKQKLLCAAQFALYAVCLVLFSLLLARERTVMCDYVSINGDFQSYNVFRRILAGQTPYVDFANYIGMAPVFINLPLVALQNTFANSLFVTNFTANILFSLAVTLVVYLATQQRGVSLFVGAVFSKFISTKVLYALLPQAWAETVTTRFTALYTPSNSMRVARSFLPFLLVAVVLLAGKARQNKGGVDVRTWLQTPRTAALCAFAAGLLVVWSNDFGIACIAVLCIIFLLQHLFVFRLGAKRFLPVLAAFAAALAAGVLLGAALVTGFHPAAWFTFAGAASATQFYYFGGIGGQPLLSYIFGQPQLLAWGGACAAYLLYLTIKLFRCTITQVEYLLYFLFAVLLAATLGYVLSGSGYNFREALEGYGMVLVLAYCLRGVLWLARKAPRQAVPAACTALLCCAALLFGVQTVQQAKRLQTQTYAGPYIAELGGHSSFTAALVDAKELVGDAPVFSIYATGLEAVTGTFQPTGCDYIIHALGEDAQSAYLQTFLDGEYTYVQTPKMPLDGWLCLQNWYLYSEIFAHYEKVMETEYSWLWQRVEELSTVDDVTVTVQPQADGSVALVCESTRTDDFLANVLVSYTTSFNGTADALLCLGRKSLAVQPGSLYPDETTYTAFSLAENGTQPVPVVMHGGTGTTVLQGTAAGHVSVQVQSAAYVRSVPQQLLYTKEAA